MDPDEYSWFDHSASINCVQSTVSGPKHQQELDMMFLLVELTVRWWGTDD